MARQPERLSGAHRSAIGTIQPLEFYVDYDYVVSPQLPKDPLAQEYVTVHEALLNNQFLDALQLGEHPTFAKQQVEESLTSLYEHHEESFWHTVGVAEKVTAIASTVGLPREKSLLLQRAALRHDEGKTSVPEYILSMPKTQQFTPVERQVLQDHAIQSYSIMIAQRDDETAKVAVGHHQMQKWAYPTEPMLDETYEHYDLQVFLAVADVADALLSSRGYKEAWEPERVQQTLLQEYGDRLLRLYGGDVEGAIAFRDAVITSAIDAHNKPKEETPEPPLIERAVGSW